MEGWSPQRLGWILPCRGPEASGEPLCVGGLPWAASAGVDNASSLRRCYGHGVKSAWRGDGMAVQHGTRACPPSEQGRGHGAQEWGRV